MQTTLAMSSASKFLMFFLAFSIFWAAFASRAIASENGASYSMSLHITPKIVGGATASPGAWPWMAAIIRADSTDYYFGQFCAGALIDKSWVLTAAHCVYDDQLESWNDPGEIDVVMGLHNLKTDTGDRISIKRIVGHPDYNPVTFDSDLALLELERASSAQPIPLMVDTANDLTGKIATLIGWGDTNPSASSSYPEELQQVSVPVVANATCETAYPGMITENMLCAGNPGGGKDSCGGDSGGPIVVQIDEQWQHAGIVSWGEGCALPSYYGVNTRTSQFIDFISLYVPARPKISVTPSTVRFGYVPLGETHAQTVTITNQGGGDLIIGAIGQADPLKPPFVVDADTCSGTTLATDIQCSLTIIYEPEILLDHHASFDIPSNDPNINSFTVHITARANFPWHLFVPAMINWSDQQ